MGRDAKIKAERHLRKFMGGMRTPVEEWQFRVLRGAKCQQCQTAPAIGQLLQFYPASDFQRRFPRLALQYATEGGGTIRTVKFKVYRDKDHWETREFVSMPVVHYCAGCKKVVSAWAARAPSTMVAEFREGPDNGQSKISVQVRGLAGGAQA